MSNASHSTSELTSEDNERSLRREWHLERVGWVLIALALLAAVLGFLGRGPLTRETRASDDDSLRAEYYRVEHYQADSEIRLYLDPDAIDSGTARLRVSRQFADHITPESVSPLPTSAEAVGDDIRYSFPMQEVEREGSIVFRFRFETFGSLAYDIGVEGKQPLHISQYVLP
jgi:hypothetical protein